MMRNLLLPAFLILGHSLTASAADSSFRLPTDVKNVKITAVQLGARVVSEHTVKIEPCDQVQRGRPGGCERTVAESIQPTLTVDVSYDSASSTCSLVPEQPRAYDCDEYIEFNITKAQAESVKRQRTDLSSLATLAVTPMHFHDVYPQGHYEDCIFDTAEGRGNYGPNCHYIEDQPKFSNVVAPVAEVHLSL